VVGWVRFFWKGKGILSVSSVSWKAEFAFLGYKDEFCFFGDSDGEVLFFGGS